MAKRYSDIDILDKCLSPVKVYHGDNFYIVPCGKCLACRLSKANDWSMRLGSEIAISPFTIWFTLTYNNKYLPTLQRKQSGDAFIYVSDHSQNIRFNGKCDVSRVDDIEIVSGSSLDTPEVVHLNDDSRLSYLSKRDLQLYFKLLRKDLYETFKRVNGVSDYSFRYYAIGEYGSSTYRAHYHCLVFVTSKEVCDYLVACGLYKSWQMCDQTLFDKYVRLTGDGVRNYVTQYVTSTSKLPKIYQYEFIRPFRLSSKSPAIGYSEFDEQKIFDDVLRGSINYSRSVPRIEKYYLLRYPKNFISRLFPKCFRFNEKPYHLLLSTYGLLWFYVVKRRFSYDLVLARLRKYRNPLDYYATKRCYEVCLRYGWHPDTFVWYVDRVYYLYELDNLRKWYQWQEEKARQGQKEQIILSYVNIGTLCEQVGKKDLVCQSLWYFLSSFNYSFDYFVSHYRSILADMRSSLPYDSYLVDLEDIFEHMDKSNKVKELAGQAPTNNSFIY